MKSSPITFFSFPVGGVLTAAYLVGWLVRSPFAHYKARETGY